jgi:hypothetical protein
MPSLATSVEDRAVDPLPQLIAERRSVYGNAMLYLTTGDGMKVGRVNLGTGKVTMDRPVLRAAFDREVDAW